MLMNQAGVRWRSGTRPRACSMKCETPTTRKPAGARSSSGSTAQALTCSSVRITMSGRCAATICESSLEGAERGTPVGCLRRSPTRPSIVNGARWPFFSSASTSEAQPPVPTTSTRRLAMLRTTCSQAAERKNTAIAASARRAAPELEVRTQRSRAEIATSPMTVPAAEATAGPSVK